MDSRFIILSAALAFVVVAFGLLAASLARASRSRKASAIAAEQDARLASSLPASESVDTSLKGLTLEVPSDSPSAALLMPLRTGDWQPPAEPAPAEQLPALSFAERAKQFDSIAAEDAPVGTPAAVIAPAPTPLAETAPAPIPAAETPPELASRLATLPVVRPAAEPALAWQPPEPPPAVEAVVIASPAAPPVDQRPRAHFRAIPDEPPASAPSAGTPRSGQHPEPPPAPTALLEMVAPIEMWFGDYRVGVKAGSKTHAQFSKYADVLLGDLKAAGERTR